MKDMKKILIGTTAIFMTLLFSTAVSAQSQYGKKSKVKIESTKEIKKVAKVAKGDKTKRKTTSRKLTTVSKAQPALLEKNSTKIANKQSEKKQLVKNRRVDNKVSTKQTIKKEKVQLRNLKEKRAEKESLRIKK